MDFAADGIRVNAVCPGYIDTLMGQAEIDLLAEEWEVTAEEARDRMATDVPLGRFASNEEVGEVVAYLAGPAAAYITGVAIPVPGGLAPGL